MPKIRYKKPPLVEAIFEFFFTPASAELDAIDRLKFDLRKDYAGKRDEVVGSMGFTQDQASTTTTASIRSRFWNATGDRMVQFSAEMCAMNVFPPYTRYDKVFPPVQELFDAYVAQLKPQKLVGIGQRYLNRLPVPKGEHPSRWLKVVPDALSAPRGFAMRVVGDEFDGGETTLAVAEQGTDESGASQFIVDVYARGAAALDVAWGAADSWHSRAHESIIRAFELSMTDHARGKFEVE